jgi:hypothetical protein
MNPSSSREELRGWGVGGWEEGGKRKRGRRRGGAEEGGVEAWDRVDRVDLKEGVDALGGIGGAPLQILGVALWIA